MIPEIVDDRYIRNMPIRDPEYILRAQEEAKKEKKPTLERKRKSDKQVDVIKKGNICDPDNNIQFGTIETEQRVSNGTVHSLRKKKRI